MTRMVQTAISYLFSILLILIYVSLRIESAKNITRVNSNDTWSIGINIYVVSINVEALIDILLPNRNGRLFETLLNIWWYNVAQVSALRPWLGSPMLYTPYDS